MMMPYDWPGNIRELVNVMERAQILAENNLITTDDLPENMVLSPIGEARNLPVWNSGRTVRQSRSDGTPAGPKRAATLPIQQSACGEVAGRQPAHYYRLIEKYQLEPTTDAGNRLGRIGWSAFPRATEVHMAKANGCVGFCLLTWEYPLWTLRNCFNAIKSCSNMSAGPRTTRARSTRSPD